MMTSPTSPASPGTPPLVAIESPLSGDFITNTVYARMALRDSVVRGEAPLASHLLYTQVLDDTDPADRQLGMAAGLAWNCHAELVAVYTGLGISAGMQAGIDLATVRDIPIVFRDLAPPQRMPEAGERPDAVELAERRPPRFEERLGRDHENTHGDAMIFARNRSTVLELPAHVRRTTGRHDRP